MNALRRAVAAALCGIVLSTSASAFCAPHTWPSPESEPSEAALEEAKALYVAGNRAVAQGRWSDALVFFEKSYALSGVPAALFNVATTLRALGRHVEARDAFAQLLEKHPKLDPEVKADAEKMLAEEKARIASIVLADLPSQKDDLKVFVDGKAKADDGSRPLALEVDPGKHALRVEEPASKPFLWEGTVKDGEKKTLRVQLEPAPVTQPTTPAESSSVLSSPVFWTVVGVVVVGGAVAGGYLYHRSQQLEPASPNVVRL